jgi:predicted N-acetyltransferase YhbS
MRVGDFQFRCVVRPEREDDRDAIARVHREAFGQDDEAELVRRLWASSDYLPQLSLVAAADGEIVGHVALSRAWLERRAVVALGPIGVVPSVQGQGIGSALMEAALARAQDAGEGLVVLLGHAGYYPRFGFVRASSLAITSQVEFPDDAFMACELTPGAAAGGGRFLYSDAFGLRSGAD